MPVDFKKCDIKSLFSLKLSHRFNAFAVNKIFKYVCVDIMFVFFVSLLVSTAALKYDGTAETN